MRDKTVIIIILIIILLIPLFFLSKQTETKPIEEKIDTILTLEVTPV